MNIDIPEKPYMIVLGTSHTAGECNGDVLQETFADHIAEELGLELVKIGLPGCTNTELLFSFNKLFNNGFINNQNLKLFLFEPRLLDGSMKIPLEGLFEKEDIEEMIFSNIKYQTFGHVDASFKREYEILSAYYSTHHHNGPFTEVTSEIEQDVNNFIDGSLQVSDEARLILDAYQKYLLLYADTYLQTMDNLIIVNTILNQLEALNKKHFWLTFGVFNDSHVTISDKLITPKLLPKLLRKGITREFQYRLKDKNLLCECKHMNESGHQYLYNLIIDKIKEDYYDNAT
jgi:hypothetical protein